jgi:hypothetical protein
VSSTPPAEAFEHGGRTVPHSGDEIGNVMDKERFDCDGPLRGRRIYESLGAASPWMTEDQGLARMNRLPKYIGSSTLKKAE